MKSIVPYPENCTGCRFCEMVCSLEHYGVLNHQRSRIRIFKSGLKIDVPVTCAQLCSQRKKCCRDVCPENAFFKMGKVWVPDPEKCIGCGKCVKFCPYNAIRLVDGKAIKCDLCGGEPHCVKFCKPGGIKFVKWDRKRYDFLKKIVRSSRGAGGDSLEKDGMGGDMEDSRRLGYGGKILTVDLTSGESSVSNTTKELAEKYLGGDGFVAKLLYENIKPGIDPLREDNVLVIAPGLLTGLPVPTCGKTVFGAKSPLSGGWGESVMGSGLGAAMKYAGYDAIIIKGRARRKVYLFIENEKLQIRSAVSLWGKSPREVAELIKKELDDRDVIVAAIGIAGENLVRYACVDSEDRQAGRCGMGAVMGSKNLKAIAVRGSGDILVADRKKLKGLIHKLAEEMFNSPLYDHYSKYGTGEFLEWVNTEKGTFPTRNWQESLFKERGELDPYYWSAKYSKKNKACFSCLKPCGRLFVVKRGRYRGTVVDGPEYETLYSLGSQCGISNIEIVAKANERCDELGLDTISAGVCIGFAMELYESGLLSKEDVGMELNFGNPEALLEMIMMIAERKGIGKLLGEGVKKAASKIGKGAEDFAIHVKGLEPPAYDVRGLKGLGLGFMVSPRGACHLRSGAYAVELTGKFWRFEGVDRFSSKNKGREIKELEDFMTVYDCLGACKFSRKFFYVAGFSEWIQAVVGKSYSEEELLKIGEIINNLKRLFNMREGFGRKEDSLPKRVTSEPIKDGVSKGHFITEKEAEEMLDDYYSARGWDREGRPSKEKLRELGLEWAV